jgi:ribosome maturation factor RimP
LSDGKHFDVATIEAAIAPAMAAAGYRIVRVLFTGVGRRATLQIMAERDDEAAMTVDDCATLSHTISALLDVADPIAASYMLEVSSPGLDRPLIRRQDFERYAGFEAKLEVKQPVDGRKRFRGRLRGVEGDAVALEGDGTTWRFPLGDVTSAKLVLTDDLIAAGGRPATAETTGAEVTNEMERR